jgi:hypothetical protein
MDPYAVLGVPAGAGERELARAYRRLAKRWHPDLAGTEAARRMAEINQAYELARLDRRRGTRGRRRSARRGRHLHVPGGWLREPVRRALGRELLTALRDDEDVALVAVTETWASPRTLLVVTDRRLLWLLDDAVAGRVRSLRFDAIAEVDQRPRWPLRSAVLRVRAKNGRRHAFAGMRPDTAALIAQHVQTASAR